MEHRQDDYAYPFDDEEIETDPIISLGAYAIIFGQEEK